MELYQWHIFPTMWEWNLVGCSTTCRRDHMHSGTKHGHRYCRWHAKACFPIRQRACSSPHSRWHASPLLLKRSNTVASASNHNSWFPPPPTPHLILIFIFRTIRQLPKCSIQLPGILHLASGDYCDFINQKLGITKSQLVSWNSGWLTPVVIFGLSAHTV